MTTSRSPIRRRARALALATAVIGPATAAVLLMASPGARAESPTPVINPKTKVSPTTATKPTAKPAAAGSEYVGISCRGPFVLSGASNLGVRARKADSSAGDWGDNLDPGECALSDRKLAGTERAEIFFQYGDNVAADRFVAGVAPTLAACALSSDCVMRATVRLGDSGYWYAKTNESVRISKHGYRPH